MKWHKLFLTQGVLLLTLLLAFGSCTTSSELEERDWKLVWADEFNGGAGESPDPTGPAGTPRNVRMQNARSAVIRSPTDRKRIAAQAWPPITAGRKLVD